MTTLVRLDPEPIELQELRERREQLDLDRYDEVWDGVLHMNPIPSAEHQYIIQQLAVMLDPVAHDAGLFPLLQTFAIGAGKHDFRIPDGGLHRGKPQGVWQQTAALVVEVLSPRDVAWHKLDFYAAHDVAELLIIDPKERRVHWLARADGEYEPIERSVLIELGPAELAARVDWP